MASIEFFELKLVTKEVFQNIPNKDKNPQAIHMTKLIPIDPVLSKSPDGDTKIPDPKK